jgi:hypothetical protein
LSIITTRRGFYFGGNLVEISSYPLFKLVKDLDEFSIFPGTMNYARVYAVKDGYITRRE